MGSVGQAALLVGFPVIPALPAPPSPPCGYPSSRTVSDIHHFGAPPNQGPGSSGLNVVVGAGPGSG
jgi:hypothetical protein